MKIVKADKAGIAEAVKYLKAGKAVVYPTDTAYGLGVNATNARAVRKLYKIKGRVYKKPTHVIVHNLSIVKKLAMVEAQAGRLMKKFWPGALTVALPLSPLPSPPPQGEGREREGGEKIQKEFPSLEGRGKGRVALKILSAGTGTIGVRIPDNKIALALAKKFGRPITTTSANPAGGATPYSIEDSLKQFKNKKHQPDLYLDAGKLPRGGVSTIVHVENGIMTILRKGQITAKQIQSALFFSKT